MKIELKCGKVFIDWSQNDDKKTTVSAYSLRAKDATSVSTPVTWEELESAVSIKSASRLVFLAKEVLRRISREGDLSAAALTLKQQLPAGAGPDL